MPPNSINFIMPHHHSLLPLPLLILLLSPAVAADNNTVSPNCGLHLDVCGDEHSTKVLPLGSQTWCIKKEAMDSMDYSEIIINDTEFRKVLNSRNCSDLFNYKLTIPSGSPITSFRFPFPDNTVIYKCDPGFKITWPDQHYFEHPCPDIDFDIFLVDHELPWLFEECVVLKIPFLMNPGSYPFPENTDILDVLTAEASIHGKLCSKDRRRVPKATIIGIAIGCASLFSVGLFIIVWSAQDRSIYFDIDHPSTDQECLNDKFGVPVFSYEELKTATNNFDPSRELGHGGFGTVYYGKLQDVREVAIKRLYSHKRDKKHVKQFMNEIQILTHLRHRNLVSLYGCSSPQSHALMLVYEYIPNGTVASHLHGDLANSGSLPWPIRMRIAIETASALTYLHAIGIIHRDVKTNNILLDKHLCVKVADFGISRLLPNDLSHVTTAPVGTLGYMDPEYHHSYQLTNKSDVYSFGVVLVELISSMRAVDVRRNSDEIKLANLAIKKIQRREFSELVDPSLGFESDNEVKKMVLSVANLAFQCLQRNKELRPSMHDVLEKLQKIESEKGELEDPEVHGIRILERGSHTVPSTSLNLILDYNEVGSLNNLKSHQSLHQTL